MLSAHQVKSSTPDIAKNLYGSFVHNYYRSMLQCKTLKIQEWGVHCMHIEKCCFTTKYVGNNNASLVCIQSKIVIYLYARIGYKTQTLHIEWTQWSGWVLLKSYACGRKTCSGSKLHGQTKQLWTSSTHLQLPDLQQLSLRERGHQVLQIQAMTISFLTQLK